VPTTQPQTLIPLLVVAPIVALMLWRNMKGRRVRVEALWIRPAILLAMAGAAVSQTKAASPGLVAAMVGALAVGAALGWLRGRMTRISVDPETHLATGQASPLGLILILALIGFRLGARYLLAENAGAMHVDVVQATDVLLALAVGLVAAQQLEIWIRCRRLIAQSMAAKAEQAGRPIVQP
jgi:predicted lipid-binding transport protein (Tim44 family)